MWALARGYDVDIAASRTFVEASLSEAPDAPDAASLLVAMCLSQGKSAEALELLDRTKDVFVQAGLLERWLFWRVQVLSARGAVAEALQVADSCKDAAARRQLRQLALQGKFEQDGQWQELLQHLESSFEETGDPRLLYDACNLKARLEDWPYVADRANRLLELIGTPAAVHLAAGSLWNAKRFTACLKLLDNGSRVFPGGSLPRELRRLRIYCMQEVGLVSKAVVEAEHLSHEEQNTDNLLALIQSLVLTGDLKRVAVSARSLSAQDDVPARDLLRVGRLLVSEDVNLGRQLWRRAVQLDLSDPTTLTAAVDLAYRLGLEEEVRPLLERMHALAAEGSPAVRRVGFAELISMSRAWAEQLPAVETTYRSGQVPVHVLAQLLKVPLVNLIPGTGRRNRISPDPRHQLPMLIRHGNRGAGETSILGDNTRRLHIDITGMLAAHDLGILDAVERCFKALWISPSAMPALVVQLATLVPQQPVHLSGQKHVLELLERQGLCATEAPTAPPRGDPHLVRRMGIEWIGVLERAAAQNGYLVEHLPLTSNDDTRSLVTLSERDAARIVNCRTLVDALRRDGVLSSDAHSKAIDRLGNEGIQRSDTVPPERGSIVYLVASTAGVLADSNLLDLICDHFEVYVDRRYVEQIRSELAGVDAAGVLRGWLQTLVDRVRNGLMSGVYQTTQVDDEAPKLQAAERGGVSLDVRALGDLLAFAVQSGDAIWVDDRYVTSFSNRDGAPVVGILEVLQELRSRCAIDEPQYYEKLLQLRASNARYVALTPEELLYYLKDAPITEGRLVETNALSTLRRYVAACLLDRAPLQRGPAPQGRASPYGELNFVFQTLTAVTLTLCRCFGEAPSIESAQAWADWLLYNVYTGTFGVRELLVADISGDGLDFIGRDLAVAIWGMLTVLADSGAGATDETRSRYMHWIEERILRRRFKADPAVILPTYLALKAVVIDKLNAYPESTPEGAVYRIALQRMFLEAPPAVRDEVKRDPELFPRIGLAVTWTIQVGPVTFSAPEFFRAAADAINGREAVVCAQGATSSFTVRKASRQGDERLAIEVVEQQGSTQLRASDPIFRLLQDSPAEREAVLRENRNWFDCEASRCEAAINEIMSTADPALRIERLERRRASSAACYYERIAEELEHSRSFDINDLLPPSASDLLSHFRLDISEAGNDRSFKAMLSEASEQLIAEEGIKEALGRVASFPVPTPAPLLRELKNLTSSARNQIIEALERQCHSPIGLLHVIELAVPLLSDDEIPRQIAIRAMDALFDEPAATREFELFHAILERVHTELSSWVDVSTWPASVKLAVAWAHSHKLHAIFSSTLADADKLAEWIEQAGSQMGSESLGRQPETWNDALHPRLLRREDILTHGLASVLQGSSAETIESLRIPERIRSIIFGGPLGAQLPGGPLLRDPALTRNCAGSIFGGDRATVLRAVVGAEVSESVSSASLHGVVSRALDVLKYDVASQYAWVVVTSIVCDLPIHEDLREELRAILFAVDLEALWSRDAFSGYLAIRFAAGQVAHIDDCALRASVEEALVKIAHHLDGLGKRQNQLSAPVSIEDHAINLIDAALRIAHYPGEEQKTSTRSAQLLIKLLNASSAVSESVRSTAPRLVWELPARQLHGMWQVELELRARAGGQAV